MQRRFATPLSLGATSILAVVSLGCLPGCNRSSPTEPTSNTTQALLEMPVELLPASPPPAMQAGAKAKPADMPTSSGDASANAGSSEKERPSGGTTVNAPPPARPPIRRAATGGIVDITFDDLKLEMPIGTLFDRSMLTPRVAELDGQNVRLRGFIFAGGVFRSTNIQSFPFVMNTQCKFGPQGLAYCVIMVELQEGITTDFTTYPITVEGKLSVQPFNSSGFTWSVYHIQGTKVY